jgi:hypothetical protein
VDEKTEGMDDVDLNLVHQPHEKNLLCVHLFINSILQNNNLFKIIIRLWVHVRMYVCTYVRMYVCMYYVCMYVCMYVCCIPFPSMENFLVKFLMAYTDSLET